MKIKVIQNNVVLGYMCVTREEDRVGSSKIVQENYTDNYSDQELKQFQQMKSHTFVGESV